LAAAANAIVVTDRQGTIEWVNPAFERLTGYSAAEALGRNPRVLKSGKHDPPFYKELWDTILAGQVWHGEVVNKRKDGRLYTEEMTITPVPNADGAISHFIAIKQDVTARKEAEAKALALSQRRAEDLAAMERTAQALRTTEKRYRELFESMQEAFFVAETITDASGNPVDWRYLEGNPQFIRYMGLPREQLIGHTYTQVVPQPDPAWIERIGNVALTGRPVSLEMFAPTRGRWLQVKAYCPRPGQAAVLFSDISDRKQSEAALREREEQFHTLADSIPNLAWWANADGYITWYNRRWYEYTGTRREQMRGWGWQSVHDPQLLPAVLERWRACIATGEPFEMEVPLRGADGRFRWFLTRVTPLRDSGGRVMRWFGTNTDVSEAREAREVLTRSKEDLEALVEERTARLRETLGDLEVFSYSIVHDLRGPLRAMRSFSELAQEACADRAPPESLDFFRRIRIASERMDQLITDALNYSKVVRQELPLMPVDIGKLVRGMVETYPDLHPPAAHIEVQLDHLVVLGNESALTQVFSNLLGNAVKFVPPGVKPRIRVCAEQAPGARHGPRSGEAGSPRRLPGLDSPQGTGHPVLGQVRIWIEDNGIGIPAHAHEKIFGMFQRMHGQQEYPGTGIGLTIVRKAMERMGGRVGVESELGNGSRFWIELERTALPRAPQRPERQPPSAAF